MIRMMKEKRTKMRNYSKKDLKINKKSQKNY